MNNCIKYVVSLAILPVLLASWPLDLRAEFYKYVDDKGNIFYVDDLSRVPDKYRNQIKVYREKYDDLSDEERSRALQNVAYSIDYKNQVIRWKLPQGAGESGN